MAKGKDGADMKTRWLGIATQGIALAWACLVAVPAWSQGNDCLACHAKVTEGKSVHAPAAAKGGCETCHGPVDAKSTPHGGKGRFGKGLVEAMPNLCFRCHEKKDFEGKVSHAPVDAGMCLTCHDAHSSPNARLLVREGSFLCLDCHDDILKKPHVIAGFTRAGHPLGNEKKAVPAEDPLRPGNRFSCASCHDPHRGALPKLLRDDPRTMEFCMKCHPK